MLPVLLVEHPSGGRSRHALDTLPFTIGRQPDNHLVLRDSRVSRKHAEIIREGSGFAIVDLGSSHGVLVNGQRVESAKLKSGDWIEFGVDQGYRANFLEEEEPLANLMTQVSQAAVPAGAQNLARLRSLVEVARALQSSLSLDEVLTAVVDAALTITGAERGFLLLTNGSELEIAVARDCSQRPLPKSDLRVPTRLIKQALESRRDMLTMSFDPTAGVDLNTTVGQLELRSVICVPLVRIRAGQVNETQALETAAATVGVLYLDSRLTPADMSAGNRELIQTLALEASTVIENARLLEDDRQRRHIEEEMAVARSIQQSLLPKTLPSNEWFEAAGSTLPAAQVGGDYYDVRALESGGWSIVLADVSGKGPSAALLAGLLQGAFLAARPEGDAIPAVLSRLNEFLHERTQGEKYVTVFLAALEPGGRLHYANTGIGPPLLIRADRSVHRLEPTAMPVGLMPGADFPSAHVDLGAGDTVVLFSDGVEDARNTAGEAFGRKRVRELANGASADGAGSLHDRIKEAVVAHVGGAAPTDDLTLLVFRYAAKRQ
ncbi:MAG: SpoIIE family protein phosphatase [Phycisphaerales bacterium]|nr:SpoIIE family protein phosphatase [Phycisphaerales bacterium]